MAANKRSVRASERRSVYAGVDAGGSHSELVIIDSHGATLARVQGGPAALRLNNAATVARRITTMLRRARAACGNPSIKCLVAAVTGAGRQAERSTLEKALAKAGVRARIRIIGDGEAALESAFPTGAGIILLSGTGSIAYARDASGKVHRIGGLGWQLGDEGSGYALGRAALGAVGRAMDGRGAETALTSMILQATGSSGLDQLVQWAQTARREQIAALAALVCAAAQFQQTGSPEEDRDISLGADAGGSFAALWSDHPRPAGDPIARVLVRGAARELAPHIKALLVRLAPEVPEGVVLGGGLLGTESPLRDEVVAELARIAPGVEILNRTIDPALGAARLATRL